ncbi:ATP-binding protein [Streptomonospora alba]|uniref:GTPase HflX n=1 Tax=Streptomonospora alba TaxID=183763 RepID=A0A0C2JAS1_9ACTN|nr:GTPase HflX [Streptomonospora alba]KIH98561.1 ATP-binding protein [Streptomonospora alba]
MNTFVDRGSLDSAEEIFAEAADRTAAVRPYTAEDAVEAGSPDQGELELAERHALRRVEGLSTELTDVSEVEQRSLRLERVVLMGVWTSGTQQDADNSLIELKHLAETAGAAVLEGMTQRRRKPDPATYIGRGKAEELREAVESTGADTLVCDGELAPGQLRQLEDIVKVKVIDRTALILDIFAQHARSREGKAQVELAQLSYLVTRLRGWGTTLSRQAGGRAGGGNGGVGLRGPGETKIETDRRRISARMSKLRRQISHMATSRDVKRDKRQTRQVPAVSISGYTNAGKSSLLNRLTNAGVLVHDELFATLDPTVRQARTPDGRAFTLSDTVGFVRHLPHELVEAFRSTLEEVADADLILHVVDASHPDPEQQLSSVREVFAEIGAEDVPEVVVLNKTDAADPLVLKQLRAKEPHALEVSAHTGAGIEELIAAVADALPDLDREVRVMLPYDRGDLVSRVYEEGRIVEKEHTGEGTRMHAYVPRLLAGKLDEYAAV